MRRFILLIIALATLLPTLAQAYDVLVLQSRRDPAYDEVLKGFRFEQKSSLRMLVISDYAEVDLIRIVREDHPRLILALGDAALKEARKIRNTPVLAVMTLGIPAQSADQSNLAGISMFAAPEQYMSMFRSMKVRRVGVIHNPAKSGWYLRQARTAAQQAGIELVARTISAPHELPHQLATLAGKVDALWMLPDPTAVTRDTVETYFHFGQENYIPVVSFSGSYIGLGAAAALDLDLNTLGRQADEVASQMLSGQADSSRVIFPHKVIPKTNGSVLKRLNLDAGSIIGSVRN
ncbi:MAG: ABC transporter substrate-binding protein [Geobacter sp.]|nr:ABC transporter substrate-binding protein [Geobacter sp.]